MTPTVHFTRSPIVFGMRECLMCHELLHPSDFRPDLFKPESVAAIGPNVCFGCMDEAGKTEPLTEDEWL